MHKSSNIIIFSIVSILLVLATFYISSIYFQNSFTSQVDNLQRRTEQQIQSTVDFFKDYIIAVNNIHIGSSYQDIGIVNLHKGREYAESGNYTYYGVANIFDIGKEQITKAKEYFSKALNKLQKLNNTFINNFYQADINNRILQTQILLNISDQYISLIDYAKSELYEVNYGMKSKATEYFNKYNALVPEVNQNLKKLSDIQNQIDLSWDQDWYPLFQGTV